MWFDPENDNTTKCEHASDEEILARSQHDPDVFSVMLDRYQAAFMRKAQSVLHDREEAEEVVQETFMKIYQYADRFSVQEGASFRSWAYKILMNTALTRYQKLKRRHTHTMPMVPELEDMLADTSLRQWERHEAHDLIVTTLARMPDSLSRVLRRFYIDGRSQKEIALEEATSEGAVKTRMHRARGEFRALVKGTLLS